MFDFLRRMYSYLFFSKLQRRRIEKMMLRDLSEPPSYRYGDLLDGHHINPLPVKRTKLCNRFASRRLKYIRTTSGKSDINNFRVMVDVKHFRPYEIDVKTVDSIVVILGSHKEEADQHSFVSREFMRRYELTEDVKPEKVSSWLNKDGILTKIWAPRKAIEPPPKIVRVIFIIKEESEEEESEEEESEEEESEEEESKEEESKEEESKEEESEEEESEEEDSEEESEEDSKD